MEPDDILLFYSGDEFFATARIEQKFENPDIGEWANGIYGEGFARGTEVLWLLLLSMLIFGYMRQFLNALNAIDRPRDAFAVNLLFTGANVLLNVVLVWQFGWVGAAVASATSSLLGTVVSYALLSRVVTLELPLAEIGKQAVAALIMGGVVSLLRRTIELTGLVRHNVLIVTSLVGIGAGVYVVTLLALSPALRDTVDRNLPVDLPSVP